METTVLAAIASPRRREILRLVWDRELSAGDIARSMPDVTFGAVSLQLRSLAEAGLVDVARGPAEPLLSGAPRSARSGQRHARTDVGRRAVEVEAGRGIRANTPRPETSAPAKEDEREEIMMTLTHQVDRTVVIQATPAVVFAFLTETPRWAAWWGAGSEIDARPGGQMKIRYPDGTEVTGEVIEVRAPERIAFTYGYASGKMIPPGGSRVTIELEPIGAATRLHLTHEVAEAITRDQHIQGWRYQLSLFANVVADAVNAGAAAVVDAWFDAWADPDAASRAAHALAHRRGHAPVPRSLQHHRRRRGSRGAHHRRSALHAGHPDAATGRRPALPGHRPGGLRGAVERRPGARRRHQRLRLRRGRQARLGDRLHERRELRRPSTDRRAMHARHMSHSRHRELLCAPRWRRFIARRRNPGRRSRRR